MPKIVCFKFPIFRINNIFKIRMLLLRIKYVYIIIIIKIFVAQKYVGENMHAKI